jgi:ribosome-binding protein aMBF1 (putative translation factor)
MKRATRILTSAEQARVARARQAADGPDRADLIQQAQAAQKQTALDDVMATLKAARESAGISLRELEMKTGISRGNLSRLENGTGNPTIATLRRYAAAIGKTVQITVSEK